MRIIQNLWSNLGFLVRGEDKRVLPASEVQERAQTMEKKLPAHIILNQREEARLHGINLGPDSTLEIRNTDFKGTSMRAGTIRSYGTRASYHAAAPGCRFTLLDSDVQAVILRDQGDILMEDNTVYSRSVSVAGAATFTARRNHELSVIEADDIARCHIEDNPDLTTLAIGSKGCVALHIKDNKQLTHFYDDRLRRTMEASVTGNPRLKQWHMQGVEKAEDNAPNPAATEQAPAPSRRIPPIFIKQLENGDSIVASQFYYIIQAENAPLAGSVDYLSARMNEDETLDLDKARKEALFAALDEAHPRNAPQW